MYSNSSSLINVILMHGHSLIRDCIKSVLEKKNNIHVIDETSNIRSVINILKYRKADVLILGFDRIELSTMELIHNIKKEYPKIKTLLFTKDFFTGDPLINLRENIDGYLNEHSGIDNLLEAIESLYSGETYFTEINKPKDPLTNLTLREKQVLNLVLKGMSSKEIGVKLFISTRTAETHRFNLMKKLEVNNLIALSNKITDLIR
ncbi:LuxR C-terminal-related transcriptional regulator [Tenacibaculum xiamenense]|uniref:LuxR C-terminal-related transcriptional regulator n=1 Tax=Tenacibaculum xiamenense TaxID=1261553 RepID=UPI0038961BB5